MMLWWLISYSLAVILQILTIPSSNIDIERVLLVLELVLPADECSWSAGVASCEEPWSEQTLKGAGGYVLKGVVGGLEVLAVSILHNLRSFRLRLLYGKYLPKTRYDSKFNLNLSFSTNIFDWSMLKYGERAIFVIADSWLKGETVQPAQ